MNRYAQDDKARVQKVVRRAVSLSRQPGDVNPFGGGGIVDAVNSTPTLETRVDDEGNSFPPMIWGADNWGEADWV